MHITVKVYGSNLMYRCIFYSLQVKNDFIFINSWTRIKRIILHIKVTWNLKVSIQKIKFYWGTACSFIYELFLTAFTLYPQRRVWPQSLKYLSDPLRNRLANLWHKANASPASALLPGLCFSSCSQLLRFLPLSFHSPHQLSAAFTALVR